MLAKATTASGSSRVDCPNTRYQTSVRAAAAANHLICWRSSPLDRRKRTNTEITAPSPASSIIGNATKSTTTNKAWDVPSSAAPSGRTSAGPLSGQRTMEARTQIRPMERPPSQATGRQRCDGGRTLGMRRGRNTRIRPSPGAQIHCISQDASAPRGRAGIGEDRIDRVLLSGGQEPIEEADSQEDPADGVLGAMRGHRGPDDRE